MPREEEFRAVPSTRSPLHEFQLCRVRDATSAPQPWHDGWGDGTLPANPYWHCTDVMPSPDAVANGAIS